MKISIAFYTYSRSVVQLVPPKFSTFPAQLVLPPGRPTHYKTIKYFKKKSCADIIIFPCIC